MIFYNHQQIPVKKLDAAGGGGGVEWLDVDIHNYVVIPAGADGVFDA